MHNYSLIFGKAGILIPPFAADPERMRAFSVIACDQHTSEPEYWETCRKISAGSLSALDFIMPEAWLGTPEEAGHGEGIARSMAGFREAEMRRIDGFVFLERTLRDGRVRRGIVGKIDLEAYDYGAGSSSPVRATEATVLERIPPRQKVRAAASAELPHILILTAGGGDLYGTARALSRNVAYDFDLMQDGGHVRGYSLEGEAAERLAEKIAAYEKAGSGVVYAMGDGNHSLAAAKAHWERVKAETGSRDHPARYALCEITDLGDPSLSFEPIYRLVKRCDPADLLRCLKKLSGEGEQRVRAVSRSGETEFSFAAPTHALTVGTLQDFLDGYTASHPGAVCDYIHGEDALRELAREEGSVGFLFRGMDKTELFPYVETHGTLPRKTFSLGEAADKRYYLEMRRITL